MRYQTTRQRKAAKRFRERQHRTNVRRYGFLRAYLIRLFGEH